MAQETGLYAGMSYMYITPPVGVELSGYGFYLNRKAGLVRRHLLARALALEWRETRVAIVSADLLALPADIVLRTRALVESMTGIPAQNVMIACSHTHSGPATLSLRGCGEVDPGYISLLPRYLASAVSEALVDLHEVHLFAGETTLRGLGINRVDPEGLVDESVQVLELVNFDHAARYALLSFGCHPVTTLPYDIEIHDDFPGRAASMLEGQRDYDLAMFLQGSCGDVNPITAHSDLGELERSAWMLAGATQVALAQAEHVDHPHPLRAFTRTIELPLAPPSEKELRRRRDDYRALQAERDPDSEEGRRIRFWAEACDSLLMQLTGEADPWLQMLREAQKEIERHTGREARLSELAQRMDLPPDTVTQLLNRQQAQFLSPAALPRAVACELQVIQIGDVAILAHPTELFAELGMQIKRRSPFPYTFVIGYANDFLGYIPDEAEFMRRGYAAETAPYMLDMFPYASHVGAIFVQECLNLLNDLHDRM
jgi:hypothetical protein